MWITDKNGYRYLCDPSTITNVTAIKKTWRGDFVFEVTWKEVAWHVRTQKLVFANAEEYNAELLRDEIIEAINKAKQTKS